MRRRWLLGLLLLAALTAPGCASRRCCTQSDCRGSVVLDCQRVERQAISPDVSAVPPRSSVTFDERLYCNLLERDAQCLAATTAPLARLLEQEADALACHPQGLQHDRSQCTEQILYLQATHERNRNAAAALQLFLRLTEAEAGAANLRQRLDEVDRLLADVQRLQAAGVESTLSQSSVEAQKLELLHKQVDLEATIEDLNHQLVNLLGVEPLDSRLWPAADLKVDAAVPSVEDAQQLALRQRCDLAALRMAACCDVEVMRTLLGQANAGLGLSPSCQALAALHLLAKQCEGDIRGDQLSAAADEQERTLANDVARAIAAIEARLVQIGLSRRRLEALEAHHARLEKKREIEATAAFEARKARLDVLAGEQDLLHDVIEWKLAVVRLRELQEELARECGFSCNRS
jgi:hypothetical protein